MDTFEQPLETIQPPIENNLLLDEDNNEPFHIDDIHSSDRDSGSSTDFYITLEIPRNRKFSKVCLDIAAIPKTWYSIQNKYNTFTLIINGISATVTVPPSNYTAKTLASVLSGNTGLLSTTANSIGFGTYIFTVSYPTGRSSGQSGKYTFSVTGNAFQPQLYFNGSTSIYQQLGFNQNVICPFSANSLTSSNVVFLNSEDTIFIHSDIVNNPFSNILSPIFTTTTETFGTVLFIQNNYEVNSRKFSGNGKGRFRFALSDLSGITIDLNGNEWSFSLILFP